ncbi:MAG TPA: rRNA maturation RNase YbeY [Thermoanaerobaculia bacterium]|nr:rRNA maturation RNase YbeY [Thermoanaerobaculia bacterium]
MEISVRAAVSGAPPARRVKDLFQRLGRLCPPSASGPARQTGDSLLGGSLPARPEVSVLFCGDVRMRSLNRRYRRKDRSTDVLSFPGAGLALGDIVISVPYASREARRRGATTRREIDRLLLHGYLHLLGYDHETDDGQMNALEARLARRLEIGADQPGETGQRPVRR